MHVLYFQSLSSDITETDDFKSAWKFVRVMTRQKLEECVTKCVELLKKYFSPQLSEITKTLESFLQELSQLSDSGRGQMVSKENKTIRKKKQTADFEKIRTKILDYILAALCKHLRCVDIFPLHEIFYFNQGAWMKRHLNPVISNVIHKALSNPNLYIPTAGSVSEESGVDPNMPDVCIVYQLYLECAGKLISTEDWKKAFLSVISPDMEDDNEDILHYNERFTRLYPNFSSWGLLNQLKERKIICKD